MNKDEVTELYEALDLANRKIENYKWAISLYTTETIEEAINEWVEGEDYD